MRIVRFLYKGKQNWGVLKEDSVRLFKSPPFRKIELSKKTLPYARVKLLAPAIPTKIILVGLNYRDHAEELNMPIPQEPIIFLKPPSSLIACGEDIIYPRLVKRLDYEAELALVIGKVAKNIAPEKASKYILGYSCLNDVTARDLQKIDGQWTRAKSFDTFSPLGPWLETQLNPASLKISSYLNAKLKQSSSTANFIFSVNYLVSFISKIMTLLPGDVISTGTPPGVGKMQPFDTVEVQIEGIGKLKNKVIPE
jgi:2-keto-4-pentenoate hydratase/2-oxohepta-3-ene-1,7-dioic acid hydratase in catechol pathway